MNDQKRHIIISFRPETILAWFTIIVLAIIPVILWARLQTTSIFSSLGVCMEAVGLITGITATVLYSISLVLMTRLRVLETVFGGLNRVYIAHHIVGGLALVLALLHPIGLALLRAEGDLQSGALLLLPTGLSPIDALYNFGDPMHGTVLDQWAIFAGILGLWLMIGLLVVTIFIKLPYRIWLISHKFLGAVFLLIGLHIFFIQSDTSDDALLRWYLLGSIIIGFTAFVYKTIMGQISIRKHRFAVEDVIDLGAGVKRISLVLLKGNFSYQAGQFIFIRFLTPGISREWHPFSISSSAPLDSNLQITIKSLGDYTSKLSPISKGVVAEVEGAYGKFNYANHLNRDQIWIAGGIGITPFISMVKELPIDGYRVYLFYSVKSRSELIDWQLLYDEMMAKSTSLRVIPFIADEQHELLNVAFIEKVAGGIEGRDIYMCGPPPMMRALKQQFKSRGIPSTSVHSEEFSMS